MRFYIVFGLLFLESTEVLEYHCAICMHRVPNVKYIHPIGTHFAVCSDCDTQNNFNDCPVCRQVIDDREMLDGHQKEALKKKIKRRKKQERNVQEGIILNQKKEADEKEKEAERKLSQIKQANSLLIQAINHNHQKEFDEAFAKHKKVIELAPDEHIFRQSFGHMFLTWNQEKNAMEQFEIELALRNYDDVGLSLVGCSWARFGYYEHALQFLTRVKSTQDLTDLDRMQYHMCFGHIHLYHLQKYGSAKKYYQQAILDKHEFEKVYKCQKKYPRSIISRCSEEIDLGMQKIDEHYTKE